MVRGLDENADEEMLRYEFSKHAPIKVIFLSGHWFVSFVNTKPLWLLSSVLVNVKKMLI